MTYILPSARGGPAADGSCSAGGDTGLTARPGRRRGRNSGRGPSQPPPPPHGPRPSGTSPYLAGTAAESFSGEGPGGLHSLSAETTGSGKEGRKERGREGRRELATQVNRRPRRASGAAVNPSDGSALTPARPEGSVPSGRASCPRPPPLLHSRRPQLGTGRRRVCVRGAGP